MDSLETARLIINGQFHEIGEDSDNGTFYIQMYPVSYYYDIGDPNEYFFEAQTRVLNDPAVPEVPIELRLTDVESSPRRYHFTIVYKLAECDEDYVDRLNDAQVARLVAAVEDENEAPSGSFADYQVAHAQWKMIFDFAKKKLICWQDVPDEPKIECYLDQGCCT